jgi:cytochrome P450
MGPRRAITFPMFGDGIFTQEGDTWRSSRHMLRPQFQHKQYEDLTVFDEAIDDLLIAIEKDINGENIVDLQPLFFRYTLDTTTAFLFGESVKSLVAPQSGEQTFAEAFNIAQEYVAKRFRLLDMYWLIDGYKFRESCRKVNTFADRIIDKNLAKERISENQKYVFLDSIAENTPDRATLRGHIINILAAGRDTTACLLSWTFFLLARHPKALETLRKEVSAARGTGGRFNRSDLLNLTYLQNVLKESKFNKVLVKGFKVFELTIYFD